MNDILPTSPQHLIEQISGLVWMLNDRSNPDWSFSYSANFVFVHELELSASRAKHSFCAASDSVAELYDLIGKLEKICKIRDIDLVEITNVNF
jgi:hypothetical protein